MRESRPRSNARAESKRRRVALRASCLLAGAALAFLPGCGPQRQLENVAKDWCLTIRASQVLPVYPLTEDLQPGDVFLVPVPLSQQTKIYNERGFLPLDQQITRFRELPYTDYYGPAYFSGQYAPAANGHARPGWATAQEPPVPAPRAAFPTYSFRVDRSSGLKLAIPVSGVPVGLGIMGSQQANGSVTLSDAHTYGIDGESAYRRLWEWWNEDADRRRTFSMVAATSRDDVYLRVVTRVFLVQEVDVALSNLEAGSAGADVGVAQAIQPPDVSTLDADERASAVEAYERALQSLNDGIASSVSPPGGSFRFTQASQRSVGMKERFQRPLVIGYLGFDVKVFPNGALSPPIPSYSVLNDRIDPASFAPVQPLRWHDGGQVDEALQAAYEAWLEEPMNFSAMEAWLKERGRSESPVDLAGNAAAESLLREAGREFGFGPA